MLNVIRSNLDGSVTYVPDENWSGTDTGSYSITDGNGAFARAFVTVTVQAVNDDPVAMDDATATAEGVAVTIDVLANDNDVDGDALTVTSVTDPANGSASIDPDGTITYVPDPGFFGADSFSYTVEDGHGGSDSAVVTITVPQRIDTGVTLANGVLRIIGTDQDDAVVVQQKGKRVVRVEASFLPEGVVEFPADHVSTVIVHLHGGNDNYAAAGNFALPSIVDGGPGDDIIQGGAGRDILIGGLGADLLDGQQGDDVLIGGSTAFDGNDAALLTLLDAWTAGGKYSDRVEDMRTGTGPVLNGTGYRLEKGTTVFDDDVVDQLLGAGGNDWFLLDELLDSASDAGRKETVN